MSRLEQFNRDLAKNQAERAREDLRAVLATPEGRRLVWSILDLTGVYGRAFTGEPLTTAHNEGRREIGITLLERMERDAPGTYLGMLQEALAETTEIENRRRAAAEMDAQEAE